METTIDRFGRIVIPKVFRDDLGLKPGDTIQIEKQDNKVTVAPLGQQSAWTYENGWPVFHGRFIGDADTMVEQAREARSAELMALCFPQSQAPALSRPGPRGHRKRSPR